jgi:hypothetical protein
MSCNKYYFIYTPLLPPCFSIKTLFHPYSTLQADPLTIFLRKKNILVILKTAFPSCFSNLSFKTSCNLLASGSTNLPFLFITPLSTSSPTISKSPLPHIPDAFVPPITFVLIFPSCSISKNSIAPSPLSSRWVISSLQRQVLLH